MHVGCYGLNYAVPEWLFPDAPNEQAEMSKLAGKPYALIRRLTLDDLDRIIEIERNAYPYPWTRGNFVDCLRSSYACFGLQLGQELAGYSIFNWAAGEAHLLNLCVDPKWQGKAYGSLILERTIDFATLRGNQSMFLEVRESNPRAVVLYKNRGFKLIGHRRGYYRADKGREDAIVMKLDLIA